MTREARFIDGEALPEESVLFLGMSMKTQLKLKGINLKAVADIYNKSKSNFKCVYLCDSIHAMNMASSQIISYARANNIITDETLNTLNPDFHLEEVIRYGDDWVLDHEDRFQKKGLPAIIRHSITSKHCHFRNFFDQACSFYCDPKNQSFTADVNSIVAQFLGRVLSKKDKTLETIRAIQYNGKGRLLDQNVSLNNATRSYIDNERKRLIDICRASKAGLLPDDFDNPVIQELIKNSLRYVLEELCGFRIAAIDIIQQLKPEHRNMPMYYVYPGNLDVVNSYFQLVPEVNMRVKTVKISKGSVSSDESTSEETSAGSPPKDFEQKAIDSYYTLLQQTRSKNSTCQVKPEDVADLIVAVERKKSPGSSPKNSPKRKAETRIAHQEPEIIVDESNLLKKRSSFEAGFTVFSDKAKSERNNSTDSDNSKTHKLDYN